MIGFPLFLAGIIAFSPSAPPQDLATGIQAAAALAAKGDQSGAAAAYRDLLSKTSGSSADRARVLDALGASETALGNYAAARQHAEEAATIYDTLGEPARRSSALNRAGLARSYGGDYRGAVTVLQQAIQLAVAAGDPEAHAEELSNLGSVYYFLGRYSDAASAYDQALAITTAHRDAPWAGRRRQIAIVNIATLDQRLGRDSEALAQYRLLDTDAFALRPRERAQLLANRGVLYRHLGDPLKALDAYDEALRLFAKDPLLNGELGVIKNRGIVMALDQGDLVGALASFSLTFSRARAAGDKRELLQASLYRGETQRRLGHLDAAAEDFAASLSAARDLHAPEETWKSLYGLGRVLMSQGKPADAIARFDEALDTIEALRENIRVPLLRSDYFSDKREVYDSQLSARLGSTSPEAFFALLERSHSRSWREKLNLSATVDAASVQKLLPPGTVLLDYWHSDAGSAVVVVSHERIIVVPLEVADDHVRALHDQIASGPTSQWQAAAAELSALVLPREAITKATHLIIVSDGSLALVPFEVLPIEGRPLIERASVSYIPTAALLLRRAPTVPGLAPPWRTTLWAFADPVVSSARLDDPVAIQPRLTASADEVRDIAAELGGSSKIHTGADNLKNYLMSAGGVAPLLHFATHASADPDALEQSRILFSGVDGASADYLFLREAYELPLTGVELAVLSACDTERGRFMRGEGVQSFSRAFLAAGAQSTVTTLWRVADGPTADFMRVFYYHLERGESKAEALQQTKVRFLQSGGPSADPHVWAAFVLSGDGARPIPRAVQWRTVVLGALAIGLLALVAAMGVARRS